jgi:hypothetical protein
MSLSLAKKDIYVYTETIPNISIIYYIYGNILNVLLCLWHGLTSPDIFQDMLGKQECDYREYLTMPTEYRRPLIHDFMSR